MRQCAGHSVISRCDHVQRITSANSSYSRAHWSFGVCRRLFVRFRRGAPVNQPPHTRYLSITMEAVLCGGGPSEAWDNFLPKGERTGRTRAWSLLNISDHGKQDVLRYGKYLPSRLTFSSSSVCYTRSFWDSDCCFRRLDWRYTASRHLIYSRRGICSWRAFESITSASKRPYLDASRIVF